MKPRVLTRDGDSLTMANEPNSAKPAIASVLRAALRWCGVAGTTWVSLQKGGVDVAEQVRRQGLAVQLLPILQRDYNHFLEEQVNKTIQLSKYIKQEDDLPDSAVDSSDPAQFTDEQLDPQTVKIKTIAEAAPFAAYKRGASDILIEPQTTDCRIRFTIDG